VQRLGKVNSAERRSSHEQQCKEPAHVSRGRPISAKTLSDPSTALCWLAVAPGPRAARTAWLCRPQYVKLVELRELCPLTPAMGALSVFPTPLVNR
jgi:hypothetical protein